jgi:hypothetical protein
MVSVVLRGEVQGKRGGSKAMLFETEGGYRPCILVMCDFDMSESGI